MKRFLFLVIGAAVAALAIWYGLRGQRAGSSATVAALLPRDTILLADLPEFAQTRSHWHGTDIYQIWREPAVQAFLQKPLANMQARGATGATLQDLESLDVKDAFIAVTSIESSAWRTVSGFRFKGSSDDAEKVIARWRVRLLAGHEDAKQETVEFENHQIRVDSAGLLTVSSCYDGNWFVAANDIAQLKALLDRIDGRQTGRTQNLAEDETFKAAQKHMPAAFATLLYARVDRLLAGLLPHQPSAEAAAAEQPVYRQIRSFCGALAFDGGKVRDVLFVGMPKLAGTGELSRESLALASKDAFWYAAGFLNLPQTAAPRAASSGAILPGVLRNFSAPLAASGVSPTDWNNAFGSQFGLIGEWAAASHLPAFVATLPVKDRAKATQVLTALTAADATRTWTQSDRDGTHFFSSQAGNLFVPLTPTIALSAKLMVAGLDMDSVAAATAHAEMGVSELATTQTFRAAEREVPAGKQGFAYLDAALLYTRLDAALRPMLFMGAAFAPQISEQVDLRKLPPAHAITRHLTPIVMSQRYESDGYVSESIGPVTMNQTLVALGAGLFAGLAAYQHRVHDGLPSLGLPAQLPPAGYSASPVPSLPISAAPGATP